MQHGACPLGLELLPPSEMLLQIYSSKATGEPPLLLSQGILSAFVAAVGAARESLRICAVPIGKPHNGQRYTTETEAAVQLLCAPTTPQNVKAAIGPFSVRSAMLGKA